MNLAYIHFCTRFSFIHKITQSVSRKIRKIGCYLKKARFCNGLIDQRLRRFHLYIISLASGSILKFQPVKKTLTVFVWKQKNKSINIWLKKRSPFLAVVRNAFRLSFIYHTISYYMLRTLRNL